MLVLTFVLGVIFGGIVTAIILLKASIGALRVDRSDPDDHPYMFLELYKGVETVSKKKYVILRVNTQNYISHK